MKTPALFFTGVCVCSSAFAGPGDLDLTFGAGTGKVTTVMGGDARAVAIQPDGKIVAAGFANVGLGNTFALVRYNADGTLDTGFNNTGKVYAVPDFATGIGTAVAVQRDGRIVVAGYVDGRTDFTKDFAVMRFHADGSLDTTFNGTGKVITPVGSGNDYASGVCVQADGKIIVAGSSGDFMLVRYNENGSLDTTFNGTGKLTTTIGTGSDECFAVALQSDGKIVAAGYSDSALTTDFAVVRYNANGTLDTTFGGTGKVKTPAIGNDTDHGTCLAVHSDGKIVVAGYSRKEPDLIPHITVIRYNPDGSLDMGFNGTGKAVTPLGTDQDWATGVAVQGDGKILVSGYGRTGATYDFALLRYNLNGTLDGTFHGTGIVTTDIGSGSNDFGAAMALQTDGRAVVAGFTSFEFGVARYEGDAATPYTAWKALHLGYANPSDLADADGDGYSALVEYGLGMLPEVPAASPLAVTRFAYAEGERLRMFVPRDATHNDITVSVEATDDPLSGPWITLAASVLGAPFSGPGYVGGDAATPGLKTVEVRDTLDISAASQRYLRVKVTH